MSILFGIRKLGEKQVQRREMESLAQATAHYAIDGIEMKLEGVLGMAVQPYYTHLRSRLGSMIAEDDYGNMVSLDGRLDNVRGLCEELNLDIENVPDAEIVLRCFQSYGEDSFSRFVGDWAIVLWHGATQTLYLARDHAGTRGLHYELTEDGVMWGTHLEAFFADGGKRELNFGFVAAFLTSQLTHLSTPFQNIQVVPPAHFVTIGRTNAVKTTAHWNWMIGDFLRYRTDNEYEEHFRFLFRQSVERRTEADGFPLLAELSGGMDSSSIVCMSDSIRHERGGTFDQLIDTVSYYDSNDPHWDELPFVAHVEKSRGRTGIHLETSIFSSELSLCEFPSLLPGTTAENVRSHGRLEEQIGTRGYRVLLSGVGGDELLGGVPTGLPELADKLLCGTVGCFASRALAWCLPSRKPFLHITRDTVSYILSLYLKSSGDSWREHLPPGHTEKLRDTLYEYRHTMRFVDRRPCISPSRIENGLTWWKVLETLPHLRPRHAVRREYRYPYLDRDLVEYLLRVPRDRLLQPRRRRAMMRRAMSGLVPQEVLERNRKAYPSRAVLPLLGAGASRVREALRTSFLVRQGLVEADGIDKALQSLQRMESEWLPAMTRVLLFELWVQEHSLASGKMTGLAR